jgi:hypothetical protein
MRTRLPMISETLNFEQTLSALDSIAERHLAQPEINPIIERFVTGISPSDPRKSMRFDALVACRHFDANHPILASAVEHIPHSGVPQPSQRPVEFAICQFLASGADGAWARTVARMAVNPRFDGSLQRPLLFTKALVIEGADGCEPIIHHQQTTAFATSFLLQEAENFDGAQRASVLGLARSLSLRMEPQAKTLAAQEQFLLRAFGELTRTKIDHIRETFLAKAPITPRKTF